MASNVHIGRIQLMPVDSNGNAFSKDAPTTTLAKMCQSATMPRIIDDSAAPASVNPAPSPNSAGSPSIEAYIAAEAAAGFVVKHIDQTYVLSYPSGA